MTPPRRDIPQPAKGTHRKDKETPSYPSPNCHDLPLNHDINMSTDLNRPPIAREYRAILGWIQ